MRYERPLAIGALWLPMVLGGCEATRNADPDLRPRGLVNESHGPVNKAIVETHQQAQIDNAVIRQHTLYPYHFVANSGQLNDLGMHQVHVLARHYATNPGPVNLNRGEEGDALYEARIKTVLDALTHRGVPADRIKIQEGLPGGDGLSSDQVVLVVERMREPRIAGKSATRAVPAKGDQPSATTNQAGD